MSASDSGLVIIAAPIVLTVGAVSMAAAGISAMAEKYRSYRLEQAEEEECRKQQELQAIIALAEENRREYEDILRERINEEETRKSSEKSLKDAARRQLLEEQRTRERLREEIISQMEKMDKAVEAFEGEFGRDYKVREMSDTIHQSFEMFGSGVQLLEELQDLIFVIIPGMAQEKRKEARAADIDRRLGKVEADSFRVKDTSEEFVSLYTGNEKTQKEAGKTPWESFTERIRAVAQVEAAYYESEAAQMLEEAEATAPARRNFYIQKHQRRLHDLEDRALEYMKLHRQMSDQGLDDLYLYIAMAKKLGIEPQYSEEDLSDPYLVADMREETQKLVEEYKKRKERQYVTNAFTVVMKRHNLVFENMDVSDDEMTQIEYSMDRQTGVRITRSESGAFEMQFQGKSKGESVSMDERRSITEKAKHFCSLLPSITKELEEEFGISFEQTSLQPPSEENIEIRKEGSLTRVERAGALKTMKMK